MHSVRVFGITLLRRIFGLTSEELRGLITRVIKSRRVRWLSMYE
jgi:hypothetical protein